MESDDDENDNNNMDIVDIPEEEQVEKAEDDDVEAMDVGDGDGNGSEEDLDELFPASSGTVHVGDAITVPNTAPYAGEWVTSTSDPLITDYLRRMAELHARNRERLLGTVTGIGRPVGNGMVDMELKTYKADMHWDQLDTPQKREAEQRPVLKEFHYFEALPEDISLAIRVWFMVPKDRLSLSVVSHAWYDDKEKPWRKYWRKWINHALRWMPDHCDKLWDLFNHPILLDMESEPRDPHTFQWWPDMDWLNVKALQSGEMYPAVWRSSYLATDHQAYPIVYVEDGVFTYRLPATSQPIVVQWPPQSVVAPKPKGHRRPRHGRATDVPVQLFTIQTSTFFPYVGLRMHHRKHCAVATSHCQDLVRHLDHWPSETQQCSDQREAYFAFFNTWTVLCHAGLLKRVVGCDVQVAVYDLEMPWKATTTTIQQGPVAVVPMRIHMPCLEIVWKCDARLLEIYFEQAWSHGIMNFIVKQRVGSPVLGTYTEEKKTLFQEHFEKPLELHLRAYQPHPIKEAVSLNNIITRFIKTLRTALQEVFRFPAVPEPLPAEAIASAVKYNMAVEQPVFIETRDVLSEEGEGEVDYNGEGLDEEGEGEYW